MDDEQKPIIDTIRESERAFQLAAEADRKERAFAKAMHWMLSAGFFMIFMDYWTLYASPIGFVGAILMAVPIIWISWKEGL